MPNHNAGMTSAEKLLPAASPDLLPPSGGGLRWVAESRDHPPSPMPVASTAGAIRFDLLPPRGGGLRWGDESRDSPPCPTPADRLGDRPHDCAVDVIVLGGGPAGAATAIALARLGWSVTILERSHYESARIGETLPPDIKHLLIALGVWDQFLADNPLESPGIASAWGQAELYDNDFIVNPHGPGWHVDRKRFDAMLARAAEEQGVEVLRGVRGISVKRDTNSGRGSDRASLAQSRSPFWHPPL